MNKLPVIVVVGPTASGKTELAVSLAKRVGGEVVSFDSMQIYRGMHIASAAPDAEEMQGIKHHLLEFLNPDQSFSVADFVKKAKEVCIDIANRGKAVIIAGGTGLYINSFIDNVTFSESEQDPTLRARLNDEYDRIGGEEMLKKLSEFDPESALRLHPNNKKRVIRAFEIYLTSGITMTKQLEESKNEESPYTPYMIGLTYSDRELLYKRIDLRVDKMLEAGLLAEAENMYKSGHGGTGLQAIGHKEFFPYFSGEITLLEATEELKRQTRRYAKRQLTWFRRDERISWIYRDKTEDTLACALQILERNGYFGKTSQTD
ncbi:MAG: tRNA (adenosine(37)-N6)-dimethylallyltransferase MiaA [Acutalibacteraceae bacterium]|nr:tRNA (adenosine(37)-N6)-dimethylallyltransferase MiaA [Acutalibacteraceae bacterium]